MPYNINPASDTVLVEFSCLNYDQFQSILTQVFDIYVEHMCLTWSAMFVQPEKVHHVTHPTRLSRNSG